MRWDQKFPNYFLYVILYIRNYSLVIIHCMLGWMPYYVGPYLTVVEP